MKFDLISQQSKLNLLPTIKTNGWKDSSWMVGGLIYSFLKEDVNNLFTLKYMNIFKTF